MSHTIFFSGFPGDDAIARFREAAAYLRTHPGTTLVVEPGTYELTSELARRTMEDVLDGKYGSNPQRTMFNPTFAYTKGVDLDGVHDCRIEAYGVTLLVNGFMEPVSLTNCENIEVCGFRIDHKRKPYLRGFVTEIGERTEDGETPCLVELDAETPIRPGSPRLRAQIYNPITDAPILPAAVARTEYVDERHLRLWVRDGYSLPIGTEYLNAHTYHSRPAILVEYSKNVRITDVTIHSQPGMGIVGNRSHDVFLTRLAVEPSCGHHYSTNTDATHFTSMTGKLRLENCRFRWQGDDFTNVHAYYHAIIQREGPATVLMQEKTPDGTHAQTLDYPDVGDTMELTDLNTLLTVDTFRVIACEPMPGEWMSRVTLDHPLPDNTDNLVLSDVTRLPELEVIGCYAACHYARGVLVKCRSAKIEDNLFDRIYGPAIVVAAESYWYEGVTPQNVEIRRNRIMNCSLRSSDAPAGIHVMADSSESCGQSLKNILIEDNIIDSPHSAMAISIRNTDGVRIRRNTFHVAGQPLRITDCVNVDSDTDY